MGLVRLIGVCGGSLVCDSYGTVKRKTVQHQSGLMVRVTKRGITRLPETVLSAAAHVVQNIPADSVLQVMYVNPLDSVPGAK